MAFRRPPLRLLMVLLYGGALLLVGMLLAFSGRDEQPPLVFAGAEIEGTGTAALLTLRGEGFSPGLKGVAAKRLVNEKALVTHLFEGETVRAIDVKPGLVLASYYGKTLVSVTVSAEGLPTLAGSLEMPAGINAVCIAGDLAVVAMQNHFGLAIVDISDPGAMVLAERLPHSGHLIDLVAREDSVYFIDKLSGVGQIDLSGEKPSLQSLLKLESPLAMAVQGDRMAVATSRHGVSLYQVVAGRLEHAGNLVVPKDTRGVALSANHLAVTGKDDMLYLYDISGWPRLGTPAAVRIPGGAYEVAWVPDPGVFAVSVKSGGIGLVSPGGSSPKEISGLMLMPGVFLQVRPLDGALWCGSIDGLFQLSVRDIEAGAEQRLVDEFLFDQRFYILREWRGRVYGYRDHTLSDFSGPGAGREGADGDLLAVADGTAVELFSVGHGEPHRVDRIELESVVADALFAEGRLYVLHKGELLVLSGVSPRELRAVARIPLHGMGRRLARLDESRLLVVTADNGVLSVDVSDPQRPVWGANLVDLQHPAVSMNASDVLVDGRRAFVAQMTGGISIVDLENPSSPRLLQLIDTPGRAERLALNDGLLMVVDNQSGVFLVDVRDRRQALPIGAWPMPMTVDELGVSGDDVVVSDEVGGTLRLPLPARLGGLELLGDTQARVPGFAGAGQYVYLYGEGGAVRRSLAGAAQNL